MAKMNVTLNTTKDYGNFRIEAPKKQTQTNPVLSAVEWANFSYPCPLPSVLEFTPGAGFSVSLPGVFCLLSMGTSRHPLLIWVPGVFAASH